MSGQSWSPAPKQGIVPLHPMTFATVLGRSFAALRHNPKVLFGFAVVVQLVVLIASTLAITATLFATFSRLETVSPASPDFEPLVAGAIAWNLVVVFLVGIASTAFIALVQGIVAADVGYAAVGEKASLGQLWRRMKPAVWRLFAFAGLSILVGFVLVGVVVGVGFGAAAGLIGIEPALGWLAVLVSFLLGLALIPLVIWLATKLLLVPSVLVLEGASFREAFVRSWRLTRGRFWFAFGVIAIITVVMGLAAQVVSIPTSLLSGFLSVIVAPTGAEDASAIVALIAVAVLPQILILVIQAVTVVVQCTASVLIYIDCRMRYEGLDQTLLSYLERRDQGVSQDFLGDPFAVDPARAVSKTAPAQAYAAQPAPFPGYSSPPFQASSGSATPQPGFAAPPPPATPSTAPPPPAPAPPAPQPPVTPPPAPPTSDDWTAPGAEGR